MQFSVNAGFNAYCRAVGVLTTDEVYPLTQHLATHKHAPNKMKSTKVQTLGRDARAH